MLQRSCLLFIVGALAGFAALVSSSLAIGQDFPVRPVTIIVGNPAGGPTDIMARALAEKLRARWGQPVIVENKPGANTVLALNYLMASPPDGYRVMVLPSGVTYQPILDKNLTIDFVHDFDPIGIFVTGDYVYFAPAKAPYKTMEELVSWLKAHPGRGNYANASGDLVSISLFRAMTGTTFEVIRYNGATRALEATVKGEVSFSGGVPVSTVKGMADAAQVRLLAMAGSKRSPLAPDVPALGESKLDVLRAMSRYSGFSGYWLGLAAPRGTPAEIVSKWNAALEQVLNDPEIQTKVHQLGMMPAVGTPADMRQRIATDVPQWAKVARDNGVQAN